MKQLKGVRIRAESSLVYIYIYELRNERELLERHESNKLLRIHDRRIFSPSDCRLADDITVATGTYGNSCQQACLGVIGYVRPIVQSAVKVQSCTRTM